MSDVVLYTIGCPACQILEKRLDASGIEYRVVTDKNEMKEKGFEILPVLEVNGNVMKYAEAIRWVKDMTKE